MGNSYRDLIAWQKAMLIVECVYRISGTFPADERFGLTSQIRRAAVAVASNIAEGQGRNTRGEFVQFLGHAKGSLYEVETQTQLAQRLAFINDNDADNILKDCDELGRILTGLSQSLKASSAGA